MKSRKENKQQTESKRTHPPALPYRKLWAASLVAVVVLLGTGGAYRLLAARYASIAGSAPIAPDALRQLPLTIGSWKGEEVELNQRIIQATDTDAHVSRVYQKTAGMERVSLWIAFGERFRDLMPHRPEVCYPGAGWVLNDVETYEFPTTDNQSVESRILEFHRGVLQDQRVAVLNFFILDGEFLPDVSGLRAQARAFRRDASYVAQIQIARRLEPFDVNVTRDLIDFASQAAPLILDVLEESIESEEATSKPATRAETQT